MIEALLAQLDRVTGYEPVGQGFESLAARQRKIRFPIKGSGFLIVKTAKYVRKEDVNMDIKAKIEELVNKVKNDESFANEFKADPVKAVEKAVGVDLPDDQINKIVDGIKAKVSVDGIKDKVGGLLGKLGK